MRLPDACTSKNGNHFPGKQKFDSKIQDMFKTISNRNAFSKASYKSTFLGEVYQETPKMKLT